MIGRDRIAVLLRRWVVTTAALFALIATVHFSFGVLGDGISFLYIVPVCVAAIGGGRWATLGAATIASLLVYAWATSGGVPLPGVGYAIRFGAFIVVGMSLASLESERRRLFARVQALAHTDALTGLPNRRAWDEELASALARAARSEVDITIGLLDLDHFKRFNDDHGHAGGDRLLRAAAGAWQAQVRESDFLARFGGEEFAFILWDCDPCGADALADRIRDATPAGTTCSIGVAAWDGEETADEVLARADRALYRAKADGRDRVVHAPAWSGSPALV
jgi:diguanylate cyclase (GGDEF)-like protein